MNENIRSMFPVSENYAYLNSAAVGPMPASSADAVLSQLRSASENGTEHFPEWIATKNRARALIAEMLNVEPDQIAFMRNTSDGFASVANGLAWRDGANIVSYANEFPANFYPWRMARDRFGVELRLCKEVNGCVDVDELISMIDSNTQLVAISAVQFNSGYRADLERIGKAAREHDALFAVDVIQGLGAMRFDLPAQYVDIAAGASHKWLCAPEGCGYLYLSERARERVEPTHVGWISVETPWDFEDRSQPFRDNALAWESGTGPSSLFYGLENSLNLIKETGIDRIENYLDELSTYVSEKLTGKDYVIDSSRKPGERSAIVCVRHASGQSCDEIFEHLQKEKIIVSSRSGRLRISPHFFNDTTEVDRLIEALP